MTIPCSPTAYTGCTPTTVITHAPHAALAFTGTGAGLDWLAFAGCVAVAIGAFLVAIFAGKQEP